MGSTQPPTPPGPQPAGPAGLAGAITLYALARLALVALVAALLLLTGVPLAVAVLVGLVVALPLSMVLFRGLRARVDFALADARRRRSTERDALRARLRGDDSTAQGPGSDEPPQHQSGRGQG